MSILIYKCTPISKAPSKTSAMLVPGRGRIEGGAVDEERDLGPVVHGQRGAGEVQQYSCTQLL